MAFSMLPQAYGSAPCGARCRSGSVLGVLGPSRLPRHRSLERVEATSSAMIPAIRPLRVPGRVTTRELVVSAASPVSEGTTQPQTSSPLAAAESRVRRGGRKHDGRVGGEDEHSGTGKGGDVKDNIATVSSAALMRQYAAACSKGDLDRAIEITEDVGDLPDGAALQSRLNRRKFFDSAAAQKASWAAAKFLRVLPEACVDVRTFNMALRVCAEAEDLPMAARIVEAIKARALPMDYKMYTTWMTVAARAGDADAAYRMLTEARATLGDAANGPEAVTALISACAEEIDAEKPDRRRRLVLLSRAMAAFDIVAKSKGGTSLDAPLCNAALLVCGRAADLEQAERVLDLMAKRGVHPDGYTYSILMTAHAQLGDGRRAMELYGDAMAASGPRGHRLRSCQHLYAAALSACRCSDVEEPLHRVESVLADMAANRIDPDEHCACTAVAILGILGDARRAQQVFDDILARQVKSGRASAAVRSALIQALVHAGDVERAEAELQRMLQQGFTPRVRAFNAVLHHRIDVAGTSPDEAAAAACIASTSALVTSMVDLGVQPDSHTYSGVLRTCQIVGEAELALAIYAELRARGLPPDASSLFTVLRTCHNRIRGAHDPRSLDRPEGKALLEALSADAAPARARGVKGARPSGARASRFGAGLAQLLDLPSWADRALAVYKDAVSHGLRPDMRSLGMMLSCMAVPKEDARSSDEDEIRVGAGPSPSAAVQEGYYDARVSHVLDDAVSSGLLPAFPISRGAVGDIEVDLREMMPVVAQVYALCFFQAIRRTLRADQFRHSGLFASRVYLRVPKFNPDAVNLPAGANSRSLSIPWHVGDVPAWLAREFTEDGELREDKREEREEEEIERGSPVGLAVAAMLRRLKVYTHLEEQAEDIFIRVDPEEVNRWVKATQWALAPPRAGRSRFGEETAESGTENWRNILKLGPQRGRKGGIQGQTSLIRQEGL